MTQPWNNQPTGWQEYRKEIDALLRSYYPDYRIRVYLKPVFYISGIKDNPEKYPMLAKLPVYMQKRYISFLLKEQGRIPRSNSFNARCWMLPEGANV